MSLVQALVQALATITVVLLLITYLPGLPPHGNYDILEFDAIKPEGKHLVDNDVLDGAVRLFENEIVGPEGLASRKEGELFISVVGGHIMKISGPNMDKMENVINMGKPCNSYLEESLCGRPLGIRFGKDGKLLVTDSYLGIFKVDVDKKQKERLFDHRAPVNGRVARLINDAIEDSEGNIYWSVSSTIADMSGTMLEMFAGPSGRLLKYNPKTGENSVLIDNIWFSNGVALSPKEDFILVAEIMSSRVLRYWLKGPKEGTHDVFISGLPGSPDNIRARPGGGYDLPLAFVRKPSDIDLGSFLSRLPWLRKLIGRIYVGVKNLLEFVPTIRSSEITPREVHYNEYTMFSKFVPNFNEAKIIQVDEYGNIVSKLEGHSGVIQVPSQVEYVGDKVFIGSFGTPYLGMITAEEVIKRMNVAKSTKKANAREEL